MTPHESRFDRALVEINLQRVLKANSVMAVELATYLADTGSLIPNDWSDKGKQAYAILKPMVDAIGT